MQRIMLKVDQVSDLHLECKELTLPGGDILVLAGDAMEARNYLDALHRTRQSGPPTDRFLRFFDIECAKYQVVLYVPGNHEFYGHDIDAVLQYLPPALPDNVRLMHQATYDAGDLLFVGATLWTNCNRGDWHTQYHLKRCMADFHVVQYKAKRFVPQDMMQLHDRDLDYIKIVADNNTARDLFVITHHTPSWASCHPKYVNDRLMNAGYHTELSEFILDRPNIKYWAHGHTHDPFDYMIGQCRVVCNPRGYYPNEGSVGYEPKRIVG